MTLFPTTVIGSLPRPQWLREVILERKSGALSEEEADRILDRAIESAVLLQERAGLDEITDGEWRRESYVKVFAERVRGFQPDLIESGGLRYPAVVAPVEYFRPLAAEEVRFVRSRTRRRLKATLPSPYIIGRRMWSPEHSRAAYPTREKLMAGLRADPAARDRGGAGGRRRHGAARRAVAGTLVDPAFRAGASGRRAIRDRPVRRSDQPNAGRDRRDRNRHAPLPRPLRPPARHRRARTT